jgi:hypothetical protein
LRRSTSSRLLGEAAAAEHAAAAEDAAVIVLAGVADGWSATERVGVVVGCGH